MKITVIDDATTLSDLWYRALYKCLEDGRNYKIDKGSYAGQYRKELDYFVGKARYPNIRPLLPTLPPNTSPPWDEDYLNKYVEYLMCNRKEKTEDYTYGERIYWQIEEIIEKINKYGPNNNQLILQVAMPADLHLLDPPCLRQIGLKIIEDKVNFVISFRSWDLYGGMPLNLGAIQYLKEYIVDSTGFNDGCMIVESKGLHLYDHVWEVARCLARKGE